MFVIELSFDLCHFFVDGVFCFPNGFTNKHAAIPNFNLVNQPSLDEILKAEMFVHSDGQLRATDLILSYNLLTSNFQAPKCVIKVKDPCLHQISVAAPGFLTIDPIPRGVLKVTLPPQYTTREATSSHPGIKEEEEEEIVDVSNSEDDFEVFNLLSSLESPIGDLSLLPPTQVSHS